MDDEWDELADTNHGWDDGADTNPDVVVPVRWTLEMPDALVRLSGEPFDRAAALTAPGEVRLGGRGCVYAPFTILNLVPIDHGIEVWTDELTGRKDCLLTIDPSEWSRWARDIIDALGEDAAIRSPADRAQARAISGSRGSLAMDLPCVAGRIHYKEDGALTDRPARVAQRVLDLLAGHGIVLDPNHVPD